MPLHKLTDLQIRQAAPGKLEDGGGLRLVKRDRAAGQWVFRFSIHGRRREMGVGAWPSLSLKEAREEADKWRRALRSGRDPIAERDRRRREERAALHLLCDVTDSAFASRQAELKDDGKAGRWRSPLDVHVIPKLGKVPVAEIDQRLIRDTLAPIWHAKPDAARKAISRLGIVMRHAAALGLEVDLQAVEKAKELLGAQRHEAEHIAAMHWRELPAFYHTLDRDPVQLGLRFLILTAARSTPVRMARIEEVNFDAATWTIPAAQVKGRKGKTADFRVPLSPEAIRVVELALPFGDGTGFLFPGVKKGRPISENTWSKLLRNRGIDGRPHGFRSSFRTWAADTGAPRELAELSLAHVVFGKVERAYQRSDQLEQRRALMLRWGDLVTGGTGQLLRLAGQ